MSLRKKTTHRRVLSSDLGTLLAAILLSAILTVTRTSPLLGQVATGTSSSSALSSGALSNAASASGTLTTTSAAASSLAGKASSSTKIVVTPTSMPSGKSSVSSSEGPFVPTAEVLSKVIWSKLTEIIPSILSIETWKNPFNSQSLALGCFKPDGTWTEERHRCADSQSAFILHLTLETKSESLTPLPTLTEQGIRTIIDRRFVSDATRKAKLATLRESLEPVLAMISEPSAQAAIPKHLIADIQQRVRRLQETLTLEPQSSADIDLKIASAIDDLTVIAEVFRSNSPLDAQAIKTRLAQMIQSAKATSAILANEKIILDATTIGALAAAEKSISEAMDPCTAAQDCPSLVSVITSLEVWRDGVRKAVEKAKRLDLLAGIEAVMAAK